jgi:hypothetical protein
MTFFATGPAPLARRATKMKPSERLTRTTGADTLKPTPRTSPHSSRNSSPSGQRLSPAPAPDGFIPPLLRAGPHAPAQVVPEARPLPPNDPLHARHTDPARAASPPLGASAYPPAGPPLPAALLPARGKAGMHARTGSHPEQQWPGLQGTQGAYPTSPTPSHQRTGSQGAYPGSEPQWQGAYPSSTPPTHHRTGSQGAYPGSEPQWPGQQAPYPGSTPPAHQRTGSQGAYPGGFAFPVAQVPSEPGHSPYGGGGGYPPAASYGGGYSPPAGSAFPPGAGTSPYGAQASMPGGWTFDDGARGRSPFPAAEPALPDPYASGRAHPTIAMPAARGLGFVDDGGLATPKADLQPRRQPAVPSSRLREDSAPRLSQAEQEARDLELARQLDYELNSNA